MTTLAERIVGLLQHDPGLTDREITDNLKGHSAPQQPVNQKCHDLVGRGVLVRRTRSDGLIGNYLVKQASNQGSVQRQVTPLEPMDENLSEDEVKQFLEKWLVSKGWKVQIAWGRAPGVDIEAHQGNERWLIEVKGCGSRNAMRVNYFLGALGELLQRMEDPAAAYSVAFPDMHQFRRLWERLPALATQRTNISALFVDKNRNVVQL